MGLNTAFGFLKKKMGWFYENKSTMPGSSMDLFFFFSQMLLAMNFLKIYLLF